MKTLCFTRERSQEVEFPMTPNRNHEDGSIQQRGMYMSQTHNNNNKKNYSRLFLIEHRGVEDLVACAVRVTEEVENSDPTNYRKAISGVESTWWIASMCEEMRISSQESDMGIGETAEGKKDRWLQMNLQEYVWNPRCRGNKVQHV